jgi:hypothetical protein
MIRDMNTAIGITLGVIAAAIWAALVSAATLASIRVRRLRRNSRAGALWRNFTQDTVIVIGVIPYEGLYEWDLSGLIGAGDVEAMMALSQHLKSLQSDQCPEKMPNQLEDADWRKNLILIGGPSSNLVVNDLISEVSNSIIFPNRSPDEITLIHHGRSDSLDVHWNPNDLSEPAKDYGMILFADNPRAAGKKLLFVAGGTGVGTRLAAVRAISPDFLAQDLPRRGNSFAETFKFSVVRGVASQPQKSFITGLQ